MQIAQSKWYLWIPIFLILASLTTSLSFARELTGAEVFGQQCGKCHVARPAQERSDKDWEVIILHMRVRGYLSGTESEKVLQFLQSHNSAGTKSPIGQLVSQLETVSPATTKPTIVSKTPQEKVAYGEKLIQENDCIGCHIIDKKGGNIGPNLNGLVDKLGFQKVSEYIANPKQLNPATIMPKYSFSKEELDAVVSYLSTLKK